MSLAIFDLDNTLIGGDSDYLWGEFLCEIGAVDAKTHRQKNENYFQQYNRGELDIYEYSEFAVEPLSRFDMGELAAMHQQFIIEKIKPIYLEKAQQLVDKHKSQGDTILVITATSRFVTEAIARLYGIDNILAIEAEIVDGRYTGKIVGIPTYAAGKVDNLMLWLEQNDETLSGSSFYSDSHNDIPLLEVVDNPVAVNPNAALKTHADDKNWPIIDLR
ncbi:MAG: HAD-IB family hydrolase [Gammaproteobacteria bacterium]|nr:HAD-IB family hydrolase [Gammaproteobacteria bacterium]